MAYVLIDHSHGQGIDGKKGAKEEFDAVACGHCRALVALLKKGNDTYQLSKCDVAVAGRLAPHLGQKYQGKFTCRRCRKCLCRACARRMTRGGACTPFPARVAAARKARQAG